MQKELNIELNSFIIQILLDDKIITQQLINERHVDLKLFYDSA
jgi:hypothetical protein